MQQDRSIVVRLARVDPAEGTSPSGSLLEERETSSPWRAVVWNDPVNLMSYVVYVFRTHFGYPRARAEQLMQQVHHDGQATVSEGSREKIESDVHALHTYGLHATIEPSA